MVVAIQQSRNKQYIKEPNYGPLPWSAIVCSTHSCSYALKSPETGRVWRGGAGGGGGCVYRKRPPFPYSEDLMCLGH
jgi:hypothetical protein